jgi:hypothetical protein
VQFHREGVSTRDAALMLGVSYRQLHYWVTCGYIPGLKPQGSGHPLRWGQEELAAARHLRDARRLVQRVRRELREQDAS